MHKLLRMMFKGTTIHRIANSIYLGRSLAVLAGFVLHRDLENDRYKDVRLTLLNKIAVDLGSSTQ